MTQFKPVAACTKNIFPTPFYTAATSTPLYEILAIKFKAMNKHITLTFSVILSLFALTSCSYQGMMDKLIPKKEAKMAEDYLNKLREKDFEYIKSKLSDELKPQVTDAALVQLADYFRGGELISKEIIGSQVHVFNGAWQGNFSFEYQFSDGWNIANAAFRKIGNKYEVIGLNVYKTKMSQKEYHAFKLHNKSLLHYLILVLAIVVPIFICISIFFCIRTPIPKRKWLWILFIFLGISQIQVNWTTGQYAIHLLSVHLFGASAITAGPHAPWVISASIPIGALLFWIKRKRYIKLSNRDNNSFNYVGADSAPQD